MNAALAPVDRPLDGYFFEDFAVGRRFRHATPRTATAGDASLYIALTGARQPLHCSEPLARAMGHRACPLDDLLVFNIAFGKTVPDISYNAVANLGYADLRFLAPVHAGDTLSCDSEVIGVKANSSGKSGIVYVRSRAVNQDDVEVLTWVRWVMVAARGVTDARITAIPELPSEVPPSEFHVSSRLGVSYVPVLRNHDALSLSTGSNRCWDDYSPGDVIDHPGGMTMEESDHMLATRLYQNTARIHFDAFLAESSQFGRRLIYGGHVISVCRALSYDGLENAFAIAAIHAGTHAHPTFAGDTVYCRHVVTARQEIPGRGDVGALRLRMIGAKNIELAELPPLAPGDRHAAVVLDLDYSVLVPRRKAL
jgi:2-methylfumaryl-CoA hydratase